VGIMFGPRVVVVPDILLTGSAQGSLIFFPHLDGDPHILYPITQEQYQRVRQSPNMVHIKIENHLIVLGKETGRPSSQTPQA
jgi:hypothetical protein